MKAQEAEIHPDRVERLAEAMKIAVLQSYRSGTSPREALNALAATAANIIAAGGNRDGRRELQHFFDDALARNMAAIIRAIVASRI